jgi:hypothetical protein
VATRVTSDETPPKKLPALVRAKLESRTLEKMRDSPKSNWGLSDIETACSQLGMTCTPPSRGSHYKVSSPHFSGIFVFPAKRPIKKWYIKGFIGFADVHIKCVEEKSDV